LQQQHDQRKRSSPDRDLKYGVSITDACIDWDTTEKAVLSMHDKLKDVLPKRQRG